MLSEIWIRVRALLRREKVENELDDEMRFHFEQQVAKYTKSGMTRDEARRQARLEFGGMDAVKEECREARGVHLIETLAQDVSYGLRILRKSPGFTAVVVLTLALGIGANTAIFSLIDAVALRALPVPNPQQLVLFQYRAREGGTTNQSYYYGGCPESNGNTISCSFSYPMFEKFQTERDLFSGVFAFAPRGADVSVNGRPSQLQGVFVSSEFFSTLGTRVVLGRPLDSMDDAPGAEPAIVLSYAYWQGQLGGDPSVIGQTAIVNRKPFRIVGIAQRGFQLDPGVPMDFWLPLSLVPEVDPNMPKQTASNSVWLDLIARLKPGVKLERASTELTALFAPAVTTGDHPIFKAEDAPHIVLVSATDGLATLREEFSQPLFVLMTAVGLVLLIACANVAGLLLARSSTRQREMAVRSALGASRWRISRQLLTESILLAGAGGALGILLAQLGAKALASFLSANWYSPLQMDVRTDWHVLVYTFAISVFVGVLFGIAPALRGSQIDLTPALKESGVQWAWGDKRSMTLNGLLVVAQVAISIVVLVGAGLLVRTLVNMKSIDTGFQSRNVLTFSVDMTLSGYKSFDDPRSYQAERDLQNRFAALPGVAAAGYSALPLLGGGSMGSMFNLPGLPQASSFSAEELPIGPKFFETMQMRLVAGRTFTPSDFASTAKPEPLVINQSFARKLFGDENPLGRGVSEAESDKPQWQVIGVVRDAKYSDLRDEVQPTVYTLYRNSGATFELRTKDDPRALIPIIRQIVGKYDPNFLVADVKTQLERLDQSLYQERLIAALSSLFGVAAIVLASIGLYGLVAYGVARRTHEIGVRMALGAQPRQILRLMARQALTLTLAGIVVGVGTAAGVTRYLQSLLYGIEPTDGWTFAGVAIVLTFVACAACYVPARRATRVDPMAALRHE